MSLTPDEIETVYEALGAVLDSLPEDRHALVLAKLALLLARELDRPEQALAAIEAARREPA